MKNKRPIIFLLAAIAVAIVVLIIENPDRPRVDDVSGKTFSPGFESANIESVEVTQLIEGAKLKRDGDRWLVSDRVTPLKEELLQNENRKNPEERWFRADRVRVNSALGSFGGLGEGVVVSTNKDKRGIYQVETAGLRVKLLDKDGNVIEDLIVGKNGPDLASNYVRRTDEDSVYLIKRPLSGVFTPFFGDWRERRLWQLSPDEIVGISIKTQDGSLSASKDEDGVWKDDVPIDQTAMNGLIKNLSSFRSSGFPENPDIKLGEEILSLTLKRKNGEKLELIVYSDNTAGNFPARLAGVDETYFLSKQVVDSIPTKLPSDKPTS